MFEAEGEKLKALLSLLSAMDINFVRQKELFGAVPSFQVKTPRQKPKLKAPTIVEKQRVIDDADLISQQQAAKFLHITVATLIEWRKHKGLPSYNFNSRIMYSKKELLEFGQKHRVVSRQ